MTTNIVEVMTPARKASALLLILATITVASCGGSGGGSGYMTSAPTPMPTPAPAPPTDTGYSFKSLVSDHTGTSAVTIDSHMKNPWGIVFGGTQPVWVANNATQTSTLYDGNGQIQSLVLNLPSSQTNGEFDATGIVFNGNGTEFMVSAGGKSGNASFIYAGEGGMIAGWSVDVDANNAILVYTDTSSSAAVYKGLALANNGAGDFLYAADFHNNKVDVFNANFLKQQPAAFPFTDPQLPAGYAPFNLQAIQNGSGGAWQLYVAYAEQAAPDNHDNVNGAGLGLIDIYDAKGNFVKRLVSPGTHLNAPWGLALAPKDFGALSNLLLVGNFGDGQINAFDPSTGAFQAALSDGTGAAFTVGGLWGIAFGNDGANQPHNTLFYAAGTNDEKNGDYGRIDVNASGSTPPPQPPGY